MPAHQQAIAEIVRHHFQEEVAFLQRLVRANSANTFLPETSRSDVPIEAEVAAVIHQDLRQLGWPATSHGISPSAPTSSVRSRERYQRGKH